MKILYKVNAMRKFLRGKIKKKKTTTKWNFNGKWKNLKGKN